MLQMNQGAKAIADKPHLEPVYRMLYTFMCVALNLYALELPPPGSSLFRQLLHLSP